MSITQKSTPNYTAGRGGNTIKKIVVHHMVGTIEGADRTFQDTVRQTSAHYGVARDGRIWQWVAESSTAWHAGNFTVNQQSIGIEHEDLAHDDFTETLYRTSAELIAGICKRHNLPISATTIVPHRSVVATACPGALDLAKLISMAQAINQGDINVDYKAEYELLKKERDTVTYPRIELLEHERDVKLYPLIEQQKVDIADLTKRIAELEGQAGGVATELKPGYYKVK
jgi:hypothetical protein